MPLPRPDLQELRDRLTIMWSYLRSLMERDVSLAPEKRGEIVSLTDQAVAHVLAGKSLRQLRTMVREFEEWIEGLNPKQVEEVHRLLTARFGVATMGADDALRRERIIKRGRIHTADEHRLISARVEAIYADPTHQEEVQVLNGLLAEAEACPRKLPGD